MLLIKKHIDKDLSGSVTLRAEEDEDMWHAYNLIQEGDQLRGSAVRSVLSLALPLCHRPKTSSIKYRNVERSGE